MHRIPPNASSEAKGVDVLRVQRASASRNTPTTKATTSVADGSICSSHRRPRSPTAQDLPGATTGRLSRWRERCYATWRIASRATDRHVELLGHVRRGEPGPSSARAAAHAWRSARGTRRRATIRSTAASSRATRGRIRSGSRAGGSRHPLEVDELVEQRCEPVHGWQVPVHEDGLVAVVSNGTPGPHPAGSRSPCTPPRGGPAGSRHARQGPSGSVARTLRRGCVSRARQLLVMTSARSTVKAGTVVDPPICVS